MLTDADLYLPGPPFRLRDIMEITGLSRDTLEREMDRGALVGFRNRQKAGCPWMFNRPHVASWWQEKQQVAS